jgi:hypothetical protein
MWGEWIDLNDYDADDLSEKRWWLYEDYYTDAHTYFCNMKQPSDSNCKYNWGGEVCDQNRPDYYKQEGNWYDGNVLVVCYL